MTNLESKVFLIDQLVRKRQSWFSMKLKVVFTNGCFDILHEGHVRYLLEAKNLGDILIVGINSDNSIQKLKGKNRPINPESSRCIVLAGLESVDAVTIFDEDTPLNLIKELMPDILVKGGDWNIEQIVGSEDVLKNGGKVFSLSFHEGYSTTQIEQKIKNQI